MPSQFAIEKSAQAWCREKTKNKEMDVDLADVFAEILDECSRFSLGHATTQELLNEIKARVDPNYRRTDSTAIPFTETKLRLHQRWDVDHWIYAWFDEDGFQYGKSFLSAELAIDAAGPLHPIGGPFSGWEAVLPVDKMNPFK